MTKSEADFINEMTRKKLSEWGDALVRGEEDVIPEEGPYFEHAMKRGWVSKRTPRRLTSSGWSTAAAFLRR